MNKEEQNKLVPKWRFPEFKAEEWGEKSLSELGSLIGGLTYSPDDVRADGLLVLRSSNVQNGQITLEDCVYVRSDIKGANISKENDILICVRNGSKALIGKNALIPKGIPVSTHGAFMTVFRSDIPTFVFQLFKTESYEKQVAGDLGATINSINGSNFLKYKFLVPSSKAEQQKIAHCLSSIDELITAHSGQLEALKTHKKGLLQQLFPAEGETVPRLRFPEFQDSGEWEDKRLGELFQIGSGRDYKHLGEGDIPVYGSGGLMLYVNDFLYDGESVCIGRKGTIDKPMFLTGKFWTVDTLFYTYSFGENIPKFIYLIFQNINWFDHNEAGGIPSLSKTTINAIEVKVPKPKEQEKIADCLSSVDERITTQTEKIAQLKLHKKGLMQGLFPTLTEKNA